VSKKDWCLGDAQSDMSEPEVFFFYFGGTMTLPFL